MNDLIINTLCLTLPLYYALIGFLFLMSGFDYRKTFLLCLIPYFGVPYLFYKAWCNLA